MIQNNIPSILVDKGTRRGLSVQTSSSDNFENNILKRLSLVDSPSASSFSSSSSAEEPWALTSYELPSPWNVEESRFDLSSPTSTIQPSSSQISSIFRHQDQRQGYDDDDDDDASSDEEDGAYDGCFSSNKNESLVDNSNNTRMTSPLWHHSLLARRIPTSPKRKHNLTLSQNTTKKSCRSWIRLATPIIDGSYDEEYEDMNTNKMQIITE
jgi:hypothetical protein